MRRVGLGLLGLGTVGGSLGRLVAADRERLRGALGIDVVVAAAGSRGVARKAAEWTGPAPRFTEDLASVVDDPAVDVVVELLGGLEPAGTLVARALAAGKSVVTANKLLLAARGSELARLAGEKGAGLGIEASVAGGIPILRALRESLAGDEVLSAGGILNGTCNSILSGMETTGRSYDAMLAEAQRLGYAEADPSADVLGADAACKLTLLARIAFGQDVRLADVPAAGIAHVLPCDFVYAKALERKVRQVASCDALADGRLLLGVGTHLVAADSPLARVDGPFNAVRVVARRAGELVFTGRGAGGDPTAAAVLSDVIDVARGPRPGLSPFGFPSLAPARVAGPEDRVLPFALRFVVRDRTGILAEISRTLAEHGIGVDEVLQAPVADRDAMPFVVTVEPVPEARLAAALASIAATPVHVAPPAAFPMTG